MSDAQAVQEQVNEQMDNTAREAAAGPNAASKKHAVKRPGHRTIRARSALNPQRPSTALVPWLEAQSLNVSRHAAALQPFKIDEFGTGIAAPTEGHIKAANALITMLRTELLKHMNHVKASVEYGIREPSSARLQSVVRHKDHAHQWTQAIEKIWDFYFELFGQRQSRFGEWLVACDHVALDCYQCTWRGINISKPVPAPAPFSYMRTGFAPATYRRGIPLTRLGKQLNPFPLIQLPYHRMVNPWTLGAIMHEVSHNLQSDLGLSRSIPLQIARQLLRAGMPPRLVYTWTRWNRETFADLSGLLLGGPGVVPSLMDVVGRNPDAVLAFDPRGVHPQPYLRPLISIELLRRMGFEDEARQYQRAWLKIYPDPRKTGSLPRFLLDTFPEACARVVETICYQPYAELGGRSLAEVMKFEEKDQHMVEESARRLAAGTDPGIIPERFLVSAARFAVDNRLAQPGTITRNFYKELVRR